jgi:hypothetical protein
MTQTRKRDRINRVGAAVDSNHGAYSNADVAFGDVLEMIRKRNEAKNQERVFQKRMKNGFKVHDKSQRAFHEKHG